MPRIRGMLDSRTGGDAAIRMPFGQFFGRAAEEREIAGFTLARFVPTVPKSRVQWHLHEEAHFVFVLRGRYETSARQACDSSGPRLIYSPPGTMHRDCFAEEDISRSAFATLCVSPPVFAEAIAEARLPAEAVCLPESALGLVRQILLDFQGPKSQDDLSECITEALCLELLQRTGAEPNAALSSAPAWLRQARELLRDTCLDEGPRSVREIAGETRGASGLFRTPLPAELRHDARRVPPALPARSCLLAPAAQLGGFGGDRGGHRIQRPEPLQQRFSQRVRRQPGGLPAV